MTLAESYAQGFDPDNYTDPWELEPYVMYDDLGMRYEAITEDLPDVGLTLRYEYVPRATLAAGRGSVPRVVMLHGNTNDSRVQGESSGWVELAAKHTIVLTSIEWPGRTSQPAGPDGRRGEAQRQREASSDVLACRDATPDLSVNELFGLRFHEQRWGELGGTRAMIGTLSNGDGAIMKFVGLDPLRGTGTSSLPRRTCGRSFRASIAI